MTASVRVRSVPRGHRGGVTRDDGVRRLPVVKLAGFINVFGHLSCEPREMSRLCG